ncbi:kunitz-type serine protease inhibitor bitisilin-1-like isoform X2 [Notolabrus celidotus]|uniref:kunitz-type serine protease inhibitor bitisilin-1-like isoform X2 n=1 Tax=Notolabrus celidotus TaxID=1203425 RepID=UPI0014901980|nr:kunitz-type serine protease inhibitor bitisilin-1-like isoform X2 [Notolabrus celidotus]
MMKAVFLFSVLVLGWTWTLLGVHAQGEIEVTDNVAPSVIPVSLNKTELCALAPEIGPCRAYVERYFYNSTSKTCQMFIYGGCIGNLNNFEGVTQCLEKCLPTEENTDPDTDLETETED